MCCWCSVQKAFFCDDDSKLLPTFSSVRFRVSCLMLNYDQHEGRSVFIFCMLIFSMTSTISWGCYLFFQCVFQNSLSKIRCLWVCGFMTRFAIWFHWSMCLFMSIQCWFYYYRFVVGLEFEDNAIPSNLFIIHDCSSSPAIFLLPYKSENCSSNFFEELCWNIDGAFLGSVACFWVWWPFSLY